MDYQRTLPMKRMAAGAIFLDDSRRVLIVKPTYKDGWEIPGGAVEDDESPRQACERELAEELGLDLTVGESVCVDYNSSTDDYLESLMFLFAGPTLTDEQQAAITLPADELSEWRWCEPAPAAELLGPRLGARVLAVIGPDGLRTGLYFEDQVELPGR